MHDDLEAISVLQDPARRALYEFVVAQGREVGRNEAAQGVGLQRTLAAFHLDRLAGAGLLDVSFRRLSDRSGPGAGRPAKLYRRADVERTVSVPPRDYRRAARVLADAIERSGAEPALYEAARAHGVAASRARADAAESAHLDAGTARPDETGLEGLTRDLAERGYEPYTADDGLRLRNCPFHALAQEFPVIACGMNLALLAGMLEGAGLADAYVARMDPRPAECCVTISKTNAG